MMHALVVGIVGGNDAGRDDLREQRLVLELVQIAGGGIVARGLPALEHATGCFIEPAVDLGVEAEAVEAALHVTALALVETDLVFRDLIGAAMIAVAILLSTFVTALGTRYVGFEGPSDETAWLIDRLTGNVYRCQAQARGKASCEPEIATGSIAERPKPQ